MGMTDRTPQPAGADDAYVWDPLPIPQVAQLLRGLAAPWWIAGGCAIDLFVGRQLRAHGDTDILVRRSDQQALQAHLRGWDLHRALYPGLRPWQAGEFLEGRYRDIWCRRRPAEPWCLQAMLVDTEADQWIFKRDPAIRGPLSTMGLTSPEGIAYLAPEIQLLYKARPQTLEKDQIDFDAAAPLLGTARAQWLLEKLHQRFPGGHPWVDALDRQCRGS
jgi:hypothetical protein